MVIVEPGGTGPFGSTATTVSLGRLPWPFDSFCLTTKPSATRRCVASFLFKPISALASTNTVGPAVVVGAGATVAAVVGATVAATVVGSLADAARLWSLFDTAHNTRAT